MGSLSRVLREVAVASAPRVVAFGGTAGLPEELEALLRARSAEAFQQGRRAGLAEGTELATQGVAAVSASLADDLATGVQALRAHQEAQRASILELALQVARAVTQADPGPGGRQVLADVQGALQAVDDRPLVVTANPDDCPLLTAGLAAVAGLSVVADPSVLPGEARLRGPWAQAEVTRDATWAAVREALGLPEHEHQH